MKNMENADSIPSLILYFVALLKLLGSFILPIASSRKPKKILKTKIVGGINWLGLSFLLLFNLYLFLVTYICIICYILNLKLLD